MNLVFIYGPPAAGKLTIARELSQRTGYRLFYNHLTVPAAQAIFPAAKEPHQGERYSQLLKTMRLAALTAAADAGLDIIFTLAYSGIVDDAFVADIVNIFESRSGNVCFVQLHAPDDVLLERIGNTSRSAVGKLTDPKRLSQVLETRDMRASVKYPDILNVDTAKLSPIDAAQEIITHFGLRVHQ